MALKKFKVIDGTFGASVPRIFAQGVLDGKIELLSGYFDEELEILTTSMPNKEYFEAWQLVRMSHVLFEGEEYVMRQDEAKNLFFQSVYWSDFHKD